MNGCPNEAQRKRRNAVAHEGPENDADNISHDGHDGRPKNTAVEKFPFDFCTDKRRPDKLVGNHDKNDDHDQDDDAFHDIISYNAGIKLLRFPFFIV